MTAPRILSPEEFRAMRQAQDDPKPKRLGQPKVTVGPLQPVGIPGDEMARVASGEMGLGNAIAARLRLAHAPDADANAVLENVNRRTAPGLASTAANVFASNLVAPFSEKMAEAGTEGALERFTTGGGDPGAHANLLGLAAAGGAVTGNAALAKATPPVPIRGGAALKAVGIRAAEGAGQNAAVSLAGSVMDEDSLPEAGKKALLNAAAGAAFGGLIEGVGRAPEIRAELAPEPKPPVAEQVRAEILAKMDPRDRQFAMTDTQFGRAFNPEGRPHVMSPEEFQQAKAARQAEAAADVARVRDGVAESQGREVRFPVERTAAAKNSPEPTMRERAGSVAPEVGQALASAGVGAAVGAAQNDEDRTKGAIMGGLTGLAAYGGMKRGLGLSTEDVSQNPRFPRTEPAGTPYKAPIDDGADPRLFNLKKYGFSDEGEKIFRDIVGELDLKKKRVGWDETMAEAHRRSTDPDALIRLNGQWDGTDGLAARLFVAQSTHRIGLLSKELARTNGVPQEAAEAMRAEIARLTDDIGIMAGRAAKERSAAGRNLNAYRIIARNAMDTPTWQQLAFRANGGVPLSSDQILQINELTRTNNREGLVQFVAGLHKSSPWEKGMALWKAGLLTAPVTHVVNNVGNASMAAMETAKEPIATMADHVIALIRGTDRTKATSLRGLVQDPLTAGGQSLKAAVQAVRQQGVLGALRHNMTQEMIGKWDFRQVNFDSPVLQAYTDVVFGSLSAEDRLWRNIAFARSMEEQIRLAAPKVAKAEGIPLKDAQARLRQAPPEELKLKAIGDAEIAVFQNTNALAEGMKGLKAGVRRAAGPKGEAVVDFVAPFVRTPTNVALRLTDYTPLGAIKLWKVLKPELSSAEQKQVAEQVGRVALGSGLVWLGFALAADGKATGAAPKDATARAQYDLEGKQANSVRMGDSWVNISRISPAGMLVAVGAQMYEIAKDAKSPEGAVAGALYAPARVALDQSFLKGVSGVLDAANDPTRYGERFVEQTAGSIVPAGVAAIARATDKTVRAPEGVGQTVTARIPGLSRSVPARRDPFGQPIERVASAPEQMLSPLPRTGAKDNDPVVKELARLGVQISMPSRFATNGKGRNKTRERLGQPDYQALLDDAGPRVRGAVAQVMNSPQYAEWSDDTRAMLLDRVISRARTQAYALQRARRDGRAVAGEESVP